MVFSQIAVSVARVLAVEILTGEPAHPYDLNTNQLISGSDWSGLASMIGEVGEEDLQQAYEEAEQVLRENWRAVEAVAKALLERDALDKDALYAALVGASCDRDEEAAALVEEAYRDAELERLVGRRWALYNRLAAGRGQDATEDELDEVWREFALVDNELVEDWGCDSFLPRKRDNDA